MKKAPVFILAACLGFTGMAAAAAKEAPVAVPLLRLSMEMGLKLAMSAIEACRKQNVNIAVTVVDRGGHPQVILRDTLSMDLTLQVSRQKAYTAMSFNAPTSQLEGRLPRTEGIIANAGGLPITGGGRIIGGVGVSGAPTGVIDEKCAQAGIDAIKFELEGI